MSAGGPAGASTVRQRSQAAGSFTELRVCGDIKALMELLPSELRQVDFDPASFVLGAMAAVVALFRDGAPLPSDVLDTYERRTR